MMFHHTNRAWKRQAPHSHRIAVCASVVTHAIVGAFAIWLATLPRSFATSDQPRWSPHYNLVWLASPGPEGGGGGGGNRTSVAPPARRPGRDRLTVPVQPSEPSDKAPEPRRDEFIAAPAQPLAAAAESTPGLIEPAPTPETTQGPGSDDGGGTGKRGGSGEGQGPGLDRGTGGGMGGDVYRPGNDVSSPQLVRDVKPQYTVDAMRANIQGAVLLECVVLPDGTVSDIKILQSLDSRYGLDEQAVRAAKQWRFRPGRRFGEPVPVMVKMELSFFLR